MKNEPAYPTNYQETTGQMTTIEGLTKLEYFAGQAMQGFIANSGCKGSQMKMDCGYFIEVAKELIKQLEEEK